MIWVINILISASILGALIVAKLYENRTGLSMWQKFKIERYRHKLEKNSSVRMAKQKLNWEPQVSMDQALHRTLDFYLKDRKPFVLASAI